MQTQTMAKDLMFKLRLDAQDRERLDAVASHYSAPAATAVRILIKEKFDALTHAERLELRSRQRRWQIDKDRLHVIVDESGLAGLALSFDEQGKTATLRQHGKVVAGPAALHDVEGYFWNAPDSPIVGWTEEGNMVVAKSARVAQAARDAIEQRRRREKDLSGYVTPADIKKHGLREVDLSVTK